MRLSASQLRTLRSSPLRGKANKVKLAVTLTGGSLKDLARLTGMSYTWVSDTANGRWDTTTVAHAQKLARVFGCSTDDLFPPSEDL